LRTSASSTSHSTLRSPRGYLSGEHPVLVRITAHAGTRACPIFQTNDNNESDLLLARGTRFRVLSAEAGTDEAPMRLHLEILP